MVVIVVLSTLVSTCGCGVKPRLRYVAGDSTLHEVAVDRPRPRHPGVLTDEERDPDTRTPMAGPDGALQEPAVWRDVPVSAGPSGPARQEADGGMEAPPEEPPEDPIGAHYATALGLQTTCRYDEALAYYRGVLDAEPDGLYAGRALVRMAEIYLSQGYAGRDPQHARVLLSEVLARFPDSAAASTVCDLAGDLCVGVGGSQGPLTVP